MRIAQGYDVHRFSEDATRPLWLGLVRIDESRGLQGHSDADVATHALCDALLGAAHLGDLGQHFSDQDPKWHNVSSRELLVAVMALVRDAQWVVESADLTIVAQVPRLAPHLAAMSTALSDVVGTTVSLKATTAEGLGALGREEGISSLAVVLLRESP